MKTLKLGSRASRMAIYQAVVVKDMLSPFADVEIVPMKSDGDFLQGDLSKHGGKGAFVSKLDDALKRGDIDVSVNCLKDIPNDHERLDGVRIAGVLERGDVRESLLCNVHITEQDLRNGKLKIGTSAPRRKAVLAKLYPGCTVVHFRGSVDTRIEKLKNGEVDAIILAKCGLDRVGLEYKITKLYSTQEFPPAIGSGVVTIDCHEERKDLIELIGKINHNKTYKEVMFERSLVNNLRGNCNTAISLDFKYISDTDVEINVILYSNNKNDLHEHIISKLHDIESTGKIIALNLLRKGARDIINSEEWFSF